MGATCSEELGRLKKKKKKKKNAWVSSESGRFAYRVFTGPLLNLLTVRVVALEHRQVPKKA